MSAPVCVKCEKEMQCQKNDFAVEEMNGNQSIRMKNGDLWVCPICKLQIVAGISESPFAENYQKDYLKKVFRCRERGSLVRSR